MLVQAKLRPPPFLENTSKTLGEPFLAINTNIFPGYKAGEMLKWRKVGNKNWELLKENYEKWLKDVERIKDESVKYYGEIWDKLNNEGK